MHRDFFYRKLRILKQNTVRERLGTQNPGPSESKSWGLLQGFKFDGRLDILSRLSPRALKGARCNVRGVSHIALDLKSDLSGTSPPREIPERSDFRSSAMRETLTRCTNLTKKTSTRHPSLDSLPGPGGARRVRGSLLPHPHSTRNRTS